MAGLLTTGPRTPAAPERRDAAPRHAAPRRTGVAGSTVASESRPAPPSLPANEPQIAEVSRSGNRSTIIVPESGWMTFRDMLNSFITGEATEGIAMPELPEPVAGAAGAGGAGAMPSESSGLQLWVENLPWDLTEEDLMSYFTPVGPVDACDVQRRADGKSRGTAVVRYTSAEHATRAIESLDGSDIGGRNIRVRLDRRG